MQELNNEPKESLTIEDILRAFKEDKEEKVNDTDIDALFSDKQSV